MLMTNLDKLGQLSWKDRRLLFQAVLILPVIHWGLNVVEYARLKEGLEKIFSLEASGLPSCKSEILQRASEVVRIASIAEQHGFFRATCLRKSFLVWLLLRGEGIQSQLCFGVRFVRDQLEAHAWVECQNVVINDVPGIRSIFLPLEDARLATIRDL
jgi:hypothetical protein